MPSTSAVGVRRGKAALPLGAKPLVYPSYRGDEAEDRSFSVSRRQADLPASAQYSEEPSQL